MAIYDNELTKTAALKALQRTNEIPYEILKDNLFLRQRRFWGLKICHLSCDPLFPYPVELFPKLSEKLVLQAIVTQAKESNADLFRLRYLPIHIVDELKLEKNDNCIILKQLTSKLVLSRESQTNISPIISKKSFRRLRQKIDNLGTVSFKVLDDENSRVNAIELLWNWKKDWLKAKRKFGFSFSDPFNYEQMRSVFVGEKKDDFPVFALFDNEKLIAVECGLIHHNTYYSFMAAYDPAYSKLGIGKYLTLSIIERTREFGINEYDFLPPASQFKRGFGIVSAPEYADVILGLSFRSKLILNLLKFLHWLKKKL